MRSNIVSPRIMALAATLLAAGCAVRTTLPVSRLESPEASGEALAVGASLGSAAGHELEFTEDFSQVPIATDAPRYRRSNFDLALGTNVGLTPRFDAGIKLSWDAPARVQLKLQLIGEPRRVARSGNTSLAVTAAAGAHASNGSESGLFGEDDSYTLRSIMLDGALIAGRRVDDQVLLYGGPFVQRYDIDVDHDFEGTNHYYAGVTYQYGVNAGVAFSMVHGRDANLDLVLELSLSSSDSGGSEATGAFLAGHLAVTRF